MKMKVIGIVIVLTALLLSGCTMTTVDQMYCLPKRSEEYNNLQSAMNEAMLGLEYCAPVSGENQQTVQMTDLDGDGTLEYLLFARSTAAQPLRILIFRNADGEYIHVDTIKSNGSEFDQVEYVKMDGSNGMMLVVGRKISDQVSGSLSVYRYTANGIEQIVTTDYRKFIQTDFNDDGVSELFVLRAGITEADNGVAEFYTLENGTVKRSNEVNMSRPVDKLKRIIIGKLQGDIPAVFTASTVGESAIVTDIFAVNEDLLTNVTAANEAGTGLQTIRNYYVYADDIDNDGIVELPDLMTPVSASETMGKHDLIAWYAMSIAGEKIDKIYTYHNFVDGWYFRLDSAWADAVTVSNVGNRYEFFIWDKDSQVSLRVLTIFVSGAQSRVENSMQSGDIILLKTDSMIFTASLDEAARNYNITKEFVMDGFYLIHEDWKTGEM